MNGAREYSSYLTKTKQYGKLYIVSSSHARGKTFRIFVLPEGEEAKPNGCGNAPLNKSAVEVYGVVGGQRGWSEFYGWIHKGKWCDDFYKLFSDKKEAIEKSNADRKKTIEEKLIESEIITNNLLSNY